MADLETIAKAKVYGVALKQFFGQEPSYDYQADHVRIYYQPDRLKRVQERIKELAAAGPSDIRVDWLPMVTPEIIRVGWPYVLGVLGVGFVVGKIT